MALQKYLKFNFTSFHERLKKVEGVKDGKRRRVGKEGGGGEQKGERKGVKGEEEKRKLLKE
jgi:hypothetical protein